MLLPYCLIFVVRITFDEAKVQKISDICKYFNKNLTFNRRNSYSCAFVLPNAHGNFHYVNVRFCYVISTAVALFFFYHVPLSGTTIIILYFYLITFHSSCLRQIKGQLIGAVYIRNMCRHEIGQLPLIGSLSNNQQPPQFYAFI